jgi:hypothetical protein
MLGILTMLVLIGSIICWVIVLIKIFQNDGALKGVLGILCSLFAFIWGWMNANRLGIKNIMMIWTVLIIIYLILGMLGGFSYGYPMGGTPPPTVP